MNLALAYLKLSNNNNGAIFHCERVLELAPDSCKALYRIAVAYTNKGEYDTAEIFLQKAMLKEPLNEDLRGLVARIKAEKREYIKKYTEISRRAVTNTQNHTRNNGLNKWENLALNVLVILIVIWVNIAKLVIKVVVCGTAKVAKGIINYGMSFWFIRIPVNLWIVIPFKIAWGIISWILAKMEEATSGQPAAVGAAT